MFELGLIIGFIVGLIFFAKVLDTPEFKIGKIKNSNLDVTKKKKFKIFKKKNDGKSN